MIMREAAVKLQDLSLRLDVHGGNRRQMPMDEIADLRREVLELTQIVQQIAETLYQVQDRR